MTLREARATGTIETAKAREVSFEETSRRLAEWKRRYDEARTFSIVATR